MHTTDNTYDITNISAPARGLYVIEKEADDATGYQTLDTRKLVGRVGRKPRQTPTLIGSLGPSDTEEATYAQYTILDLDFPAELIASSTPGHYHLYLDKPISHAKWEALMVALAEAGIIEPGYANSSRSRGYNMVRLDRTKGQDGLPANDYNSF